MRRPLLCGCICLFLSIALWMQLVNPPPFHSGNADWEGDFILLTGQVYQKEYRVSYGEEIVVLYLKSILYSEEAQASYLEKKQASKKLSDKNPTENIICELKMSELSEGSFVPKLGSRIWVRGKWQNFQHAANPGEFDAANYYAILGIGGKLQNAELLGAGETHWQLPEMLYQCRQYLLGNLYKAFPQKEASLLAKMLLGDGSGLDKEVRDLYQNNGIVHILSISGLHITMIGMGLYKGLRKVSCPMWLAAILGGLLILLYGIMTGFGISACRAIGMYLIRMLGEIWGRTYDMLTAMGVLAVTMLLKNPRLVYHSGFLLSFASVCGVGLLSPVLQPSKGWFRKRPGEKQISSIGKKVLQKLTEGLGVSGAVTLFTLPVQLFFFYKIPMYGVLINLFVIPLMSVVMCIGLLVMFMPGLAFLSPVETWIFAWFEWLCNAFEKLPGHTWLTGRPAMWRILVYYALLLTLVCLGKRKKPCIYPGLGILVLFIGIRLPEGLQITFLDVGQGDCICVQTAEGECFLFDGGSSSRSNVGEKVILPFLQYQGIDHIDGVFLSHPDTDHYSGILQILEEKWITIDRLYLPEVGKESWKDFQTLLESVGDTKVQCVAKGDCWEQGAFSLTCLHPARGYEAESNAYSACYLLEEGTFSLLLTGDVEGEGEQLLTKELALRGIRKVNVLKVAHHGSKYSTSEEFLRELDAEVSVISCGRGNAYGHPHAETLKRLEEEGGVIWTTMDYGAITVKVGKEIEVYGYY